ncbi:hypothetical protein L345_17986 [Ophiophagus hannah]|uniref:Uncharacterized protein n=1 Tax=Ophiophagus hannah TaxID=8665 RepID=V8N3R4_OPHHA|nr:hypothetical protein L345_17986 [Ophiophagus hannah]
MEPFQLTITLL